MTTMLIPETIELGHIKKRTVVAVHIDRAEFIQIVEDQIAYEYYEGCPRYDDDARKFLHDELLPVAQTMDRFPLGEWIHEDRGCGCLVGEYLIAADIIDRALYVAFKNDELSWDEEEGITFNVNVQEELHKHDGGEILETFGLHIDEAMRVWMKSRVDLCRYDDPSVILIDD